MLVVPEVETTGKPPKLMGSDGLASVGPGFNIGGVTMASTINPLKMSLIPFCVYAYQKES